MLNKRRSDQKEIEFLDTFRFKRATIEQPKRKEPLPRLPFVIIHCIDEYLQHDKCDKSECANCHTSFFRSLHAHYIEEMIYHKSFSFGYKLTEEQAGAVMEMIEGKRHTMLLGMPGTGKSLVLRVFRRVVEWIGIMTAQFHAHTGVAAVNIDGLTIASRFSSEMNDMDLFWDRKTNWYKVGMKKPSAPKHTQDFDGYIVIDEVSQVCKDTFNKFLDIAYKRNKKLIFAGDIMQLEPVKSVSGICLLNNPFHTQLSFVVLTEVKRQSESETVLRQLIYNVGFNEDTSMIRKVLCDLKQKYDDLAPEQRKDVLHIAVTNRDVDIHNKRMYDSIENEEFLHYPVVMDVMEVRRRRRTNCISCVIQTCLRCSFAKQRTGCEDCRVVRWCKQCAKIRETVTLASSPWKNTARAEPQDSNEDAQFCLLMCKQAKHTATDNENVPHYNQQLIQEFPGLKTTMNSHRAPADQLIRLKPGIKVMVTKNISKMTRRGWTSIPNGTMAKLISIDHTEAVIMCDGTNKYVTIPYRTHKLYIKKKKEDQTLVSCFANVAYYPLVCSFACTIHKSQGLTLPKVVIDMGTFPYHVKAALLYVALSRCTSLEQIYLKNHFDITRLKNNEECIGYFKNLMELAREACGKPFTLNQ